MTRAWGEDLSGRSFSRLTVIREVKRVKGRRQWALILGFIESRGGSWSIGELADALAMQKSTVSARLNEMLNETGEPVVKPKRKDRLTNITIRPVGLPAKQGELFQ